MDEFLAKYADTQLKTAALDMAAEAMQRKGDSVKAVIYAQSALDSDPKDFQSSTSAFRRTRQTNGKTTWTKRKSWANRKNWRMTRSLPFRVLRNPIPRFLTISGLV